MERLPTSKLVGRLAAILAVGFIAGFALRSAATPSARTEPPAEATSGDPAIASQPERAAAVDGPGPTRIESGVPAGFTRSEAGAVRSEEHTSELQSLMRLSYAVFCFKKKNKRHA